METRSRFARLVTAVVLTALLGAALMIGVPSQSYADGFPIVPPVGVPQDTTITTGTVTSAPSSSTTNPYDAATLLETLYLVTLSI
jgi:hypothetical protein